MTDVMVSVDGLGKRYRIAHQRERYGRLTESLSGAVRAPFDRLRGSTKAPSEWFWALQDVDFEVQRGDVLGIIGRNGAGKTTLLKLLSRITEPTVGLARLRGRVGSLLEVGTGFHPELTGRENIYMSAAILGMRRLEIDRKFDEIVDFAGVDQFLDTPIKRYSSGMQVRLGFAVAAHLETEILIVDEVLAVGDAEFQRKCLSKMENVAHAGRTVLFVSHNMPAVESLCTKGLLLERGVVVKLGSAREAVEGYLNSAVAMGASNLRDRRDRHGSGRLRFTSVDCALRTGEPSSLKFDFVAEPGTRDLAISVGMFTSRGEGALYLASEMTADRLGDLPTSGTIVCDIDRMGLLPGTYSMNVYCTVNGVVADWIVDAAMVEVLEGDYFGTGRLPPVGYGSVAIPHHWSLEAE